jgi:hypothetical protein
MHIERVASRGPRRPSGTEKVLPADDHAEVLEQCSGQAGLHRREWHPPFTVAQDPVAVHGRDVGSVMLDAGPQRRQPTADIELAGRDPNPVLQAVLRLRRTRFPLHEEQSGTQLTGQICPPRRFRRPPKENDIHETGR